MSLDLLGLIDAVSSHALASGHFDSVAGHEPKRAPGNGLAAATWFERLGSVARRSGLDATSARVELSVRITTSMLAEPQDGIDPAMVGAVDALMRAYNGDFTLGDRVSQVDVFGAYGAPLEARAGHLTQDGKPLRACVITLPLIVNDLYDQEA